MTGKEKQNQILPPKDFAQILKSQYGDGGHTAEHLFKQISKHGLRPMSEERAYDRDHDEDIQAEVDKFLREWNDIAKKYEELYGVLNRKNKRTGDLKLSYCDVKLAQFIERVYNVDIPRANNKNYAIIEKFAIARTAINKYLRKFSEEKKNGLEFDLDDRLKDLFLSTYDGEKTYLQMAEEEIESKGNNRSKNSATIIRGSNDNIRMNLSALTIVLSQMTVKEEVMGVDRENVKERLREVIRKIKDR